MRDFKDICFHSYFSVMDGLLEAGGETIMVLRYLSQRLMSHMYICVLHF